MLSDFFLRLRALFKRPTVEHELDEELRFHVDHQVEAYLNAGLDRDEAVRRAHLAFGGLDQVKEEYRDTLGGSMMTTLARRTLCGSHAPPLASVCCDRRHLARPRYWRGIPSSQRRECTRTETVTCERSRPCDVCTAGRIVRLTLISRVPRHPGPQCDL